MTLILGLTAGNIENRISSLVAYLGVENVPGLDCSEKKKK